MRVTVGGFPPLDEQAAPECGHRLAVTVDWSAFTRAVWTCRSRARLSRSLLPFRHVQYAGFRKSRQDVGVGIAGFG